MREVAHQLTRNRLSEFVIVTTPLWDVFELVWNVCVVVDKRDDKSLCFSYAQYFDSTRKHNAYFSTKERSPPF